MDVLQRAQQRTKKIVRVLEHLLGEAERAGTIQPGDKEAWQNFIYVYKYLMGGNEEEGAALCSVVPGNPTRGNGH